MSLTVHPGDVAGSTPAPGSKSVTHRAIFLSLVAGGGTVASPLWSEDTRASHEAIRAFGVETVPTRSELVVRGADPGPAEVDAANSGTTLRIATAIAALADGTSRLAGDASLNERPMGPLVEALRELGAGAACRGDEGRPPVEVEGPAGGGKATVDASRSSQYVTALLMAGPRLPEGLELSIAGELASRPYVELTCRVLEDAGVDVERRDSLYRVPAQQLRPTRVRVPGDYSAAAFPLVAGAVAGGTVEVTNLPPDTGQGDERLPELLEAFGAPVNREGEALRVTGRADEPASLDLGDNPDLFPPLAALAAHVDGTTELTGAPHLRDKESDRIEAMVEGLRALGVQAEPLEGGARIRGGSVAGGTVDGRGDHRIQMAFSVAALAADEPVAITGPTGAHRVSYPGFPRALRDLGARVEADAGARTEPQEEVA